MKPAKGFFILGNVVVFTLGSMLMLAGLRTYHECFLTLQKKLMLEEAITVAEASIHNLPTGTRLAINQNETAQAELSIKEVQICHNDKIIFSLAKAK